MKQVTCPHCDKPFILFSPNEKKVVDALKKDNMNFHQISIATGITNPPSLARAIAKLDKEGVICWLLSASDRRSKIYALNVKEPMHI